MEFELLVVTTNQYDFCLPKKININSNAVIGNQAKYHENTTFIHNNKRIKYITTDDIGVGKNRNLVLLNSKADICLLCDDDILLNDNVESIIKSVFLKNKNADLIIFNLKDSNNMRYKIKSYHKINYFNFMKYGAPRIAFKREKIIKNNIFFNLDFGGGSKYGSGEDTLFLKSCLDLKLNIHASPIEIGEILNERSSSWFDGYNDKYFFDKGALFFKISKHFFIPLIVRFLFKNYSVYNGNKNLFSLFIHMMKGAKNIRKTK